MTDQAREFYEILGEEIKSHRLKSGLEIEYVAENVNLSVRSYLEIEEGRRKISAYTLNLILKIVDADGFGKN